MTTAGTSDTIIAANDDFTAIDHLLAAYRLTNDPFGKHLIGLALINVGQKMSRDMSDHDTVLNGELNRNAGRPVL